MTNQTAAPSQFQTRREDEGPPFPLREFGSILWSRRPALLLALVAGFFLSLAAGCLRSKKYTADVLLMPPEASTLSTTSTLTALNASSLTAGFGSGGGILNSRTPGATVIGILGSRIVLDHIVDRFHLVAMFHSRYQQDARDALARQTVLTEDKKSGLLSVSVTSKDPVLARDLADAYVSELDGALHSINTSSAHRERTFLEERLKSLKVEIDDLALQLSSFASKTGTLNPQAQGQALVESAAKAERDLGVAQAELSSLRATYTDGNVRVRAAIARVNSLGGQLNAFGHLQDPDAAARENQMMPNFRQLPTLGLTYTNLNQQLTSEQAVYATLFRQYELARVEEAKQVPVARVLDKAVVPARPSSISLLLFTLAGTALSGVCALSVLAVQAFWRLSGESAQATPTVLIPSAVQGRT